MPSVPFVPFELVFSFIQGSPSSLTRRLSSAPKTVGSTGSACSRWSGTRGCSTTTHERLASSPTVGGNSFLAPPAPFPLAGLSWRTAGSIPGKTKCPGSGNKPLKFGPFFATRPPNHTTIPITTACTINEPACLCRVPGAGRSSIKSNALGPPCASAAPRSSKNARAFCFTRTIQLSSFVVWKILLKRPERESPMTRLLFQISIWPCEPLPPKIKAAHVANCEPLNSKMVASKSALLPRCCPNLEQPEAHLNRYRRPHGPPTWPGRCFAPPRPYRLYRLFVQSQPGALRHTHVRYAVIGLDNHFHDHDALIFRLPRLFRVRRFLLV